MKAELLLKQLLAIKLAEFITNSNSTDIGIYIVVSSITELTLKPLCVGRKWQQAEI